MSAIQQSSANNSHLKKYKKVKYLGKGSYGAAILVELRGTNTKYVIKEIVIGHLKPSEQEAAKKEADVLHLMNHSNITSYIESFVENSKLYIVMEHADGGDLSAAITKRRTENKYYLEEEAMRIFVQICFALRHIHKANILHRDLKSQNIFLTSNGMVKLGDFGIAKVLDASEDQAKTQIGTPYYLSPEICESKPYGTKSDMWSLGVVLYEILALEMPFQANSLPALVHRICSQEPNYSKLEGKYSSTLIDLCKSLLLKNPDLRPSVNQIVKTDFIKNHISKLLSFTLKSGTGGCLDDSGSNGGGGGINQMDPDEIERNIEVVRGKQPASFAQQDPRQVAREQQLERMRNIRQDMIKKQNNPERKESDGRRPYSPMRGDRDRAISPKNARPLSPKRDPYRPLSPKPNGSNNRAVSPKPSLRQPAAGGGNPFGRQGSDVVVSSSQQQGGNNYESAARREYFANRAAAQAIKAKVEQYERGSGMAAVSMAGGGGGGNNDMAVVAGVAGGGVAGGRYGRNEERDRDRERRPSDLDLDNMDPQTRIAMLKAQREQEREREIAAKEMQMKQAIEANREDRRRLEGLAAAAKANGGGGVVTGMNDDFSRGAQAKKALAFDINIGNNDGPVAAAPRSRVSIGGGGGSNAEPPSIAEPAPVKQRRGWGPPVDGQEILQAKAIARGGAGAGSGISSTSSSTKSKQGVNRMEVMGSSAEENNSGKAQSSAPTSSSGYNTPTSREVSMSDLNSDPSLVILEDDENNREVLKRLESKRKSQLEVKNEAKEVLRKLREKKLSQAHGSHQPKPRGQ
jgi:serine/threonine protein kinase